MRLLRSAGPCPQLASTSAPVFNICTGKGTTVRALADTMATLYHTELVAVYRPARAGEVRVSIGDPRLTAAMLDFRAVTTFGRWSSGDARPPRVQSPFETPAQLSHADRGGLCRAVYLTTLDAAAVEMMARVASLPAFLATRPAVDEPSLQAEPELCAGSDGGIANKNGSHACPPRSVNANHDILLKVGLNER
jgi:hypothetical protein